MPGTLSVVIPAHNEEGRIADTVRGHAHTYAALGIDYEIVVIVTECILVSMSASDLGVRLQFGRPNYVRIA